MASIWTMDIPTIVFSRIVSDFSEDLKTKYGMKKVTANGVTTWANFSTQQVSESDDKIFPYITIVTMPSPEIGRTLDGDSINGIRMSFQVDVIDNKTNAQSRTKPIMAEVVRIMKTMRFTVNPMPYPEDSQKESRMISRFSRAIGANDLL